MVFQSCLPKIIGLPKIMSKTTTERIVLHQRNFRAFSGLFTISNQFRAWAGLGFIFLGSIRVRV